MSFICLFSYDLILNFLINMKPASNIFFGHQCLIKQENIYIEASYQWDYLKNWENYYAFGF